MWKCDVAVLAVYHLEQVEGDDYHRLVSMRVVFETAETMKPNMTISPAPMMRLKVCSHKQDRYFEDKRLTVGCLMSIFHRWSVKILTDLRL